MNKDKIHNISSLKANRINLRNSLTPAEALLWKHLKNYALGRKFRRQHSVGRYILDFYCPSEKLAIELDGKNHFSDSGFEYDGERTKYLNSLNIRVLRFENIIVFQNIEGVLEKIKSQFTH